MIRKRWFRLSFVCIAVVVCSAMFVFGCSGPLDAGGGTPGGGSAKSAEDLYFEGVAELEQGRINGGYNKFAQSLAVDSTYLPSILGLTLADLALMAADPGVVAYAKNTLGLTEYPTSADDVFAPTWLYEEEFTDEFGQYTALVPEVDGMEDFDGFFDRNEEGEPQSNGVFEPQERFIAMVANALKSNTVLNTTVDLASNVLGARLDRAIARLQALPPGLTFTFTAAMFKLDPEEDDFPEAGITVGRAEALLAAAQLQSLRATTHMIKVLELALPLDDYFNVLASGDEELIVELTSPFAAGLLGLRDDAQSLLDQAKASEVAALTNLKNAIAEIAGRTGGAFHLSPEGGAFAEDEDPEAAWDQVQLMQAFLDIGLGKTIASIQSPQVVYYPFFEFLVEEGEGADTDYEPNWERINHYSVEENWPVGPQPHPDLGDVAIGFNAGMLYQAVAGPIAFLIELDEGEPLIYKLEYDDVEDTYDVLEPTDTYESGYTYALKMPDITFGGIVEANSLPLDDWNARDDENGNGDGENGDDGRDVWFVREGDAVALYILMPDYVSEAVLDPGFTGSFWWLLPWIEEPEPDPEPGPE